jgi:sulfofructose kinase
MSWKYFAVKASIPMARLGGDQATSGSVIVASREHSSRAISTRQPISPAPLNEAAKELARVATWIHVDHVGIQMLEPAGITRGAGGKISFDAGYGVADFDVRKVDLFAPNDNSLLSRHPGKAIEDALQIDSISLVMESSSQRRGVEAVSGTRRRVD